MTSGLITGDPPAAARLAARLAAVRSRSLELIEPLEPEDLCLQGMADASPPKWHLGHTTWFFEQFVLRPQLAAGLPLAYEPAPEAWTYLFNSYYDAVGDRHPRPQRGLLSRPPIDAVLAWRQRVDAALARLPELLERCEPGRAAAGMEGAAAAAFASTTRHRATASGWNPSPSLRAW
jgi:hypothetical protein